MNNNNEPELNNNNSGSNTKITVQNLTKSFSGITVLNDINLEFFSGEINQFRKDYKCKKTFVNQFSQFYEE